MDHYIKPLLEYRKLVLTLTVLAVVAGVAVWYFMPAGYQTTTSVLLKPISADPLDGIEADTGDAVDIQTELLIATSNAVTNLAVEDLASQSISTSSAELADQVSASSPKNTKILEITFEAATPELAQIGADTMARSYLTYRAAIATDNRAVAVDALNQRISLLKENLAEVETDLNRAAPETQPHIALSVERDSLLAELTAQQDALAALSTLSVAAGEILDPADLPTSRAGLDLLTTIVGSLVAGLILGSVLAMLISAVKASNASRTRRSTDRVEYGRRREDRAFAGGRRATDKAAPLETGTADENLAHVTVSKRPVTPSEKGSGIGQAAHSVDDWTDTPEAKPIGMGEAAWDPLAIAVQAGINSSVGNDTPSAPPHSVGTPEPEPTSSPPPPPPPQHKRAEAKLNPTQQIYDEPPPPPPAPPTRASHSIDAVTKTQAPQPSDPQMPVSFFLDDFIPAPPPPPHKRNKTAAANGFDRDNTTNADGDLEDSHQDPPPSAKPIIAPSNLLAEGDYGRLTAGMAGLDQPVALLAVGEMTREEARAAAFSLADALNLVSSNVLIVDAVLDEPTLSDTLRLDESPGLSDVLLGQTSLDAVVQAVPELDRINAISAGRPNALAKSALSTEMVGRILRAAKRRFGVTIMVAGDVEDAAMITQASDDLDGVVVSTQHPVGHAPADDLARTLRDLPAPVWVRMSTGSLEAAAKNTSTAATM